MKIDCYQLREVVKGFSLVQECDVLRNGVLRIATPFSYSNGSQIDLFLESTNPLFSEYVLSDYGQTANYLLDQHLKPWSTSKRRQLIQDICNVLEVEQNAGSFKLRLADDLSDLSSVIVRLAQACIRVSDLSFTQRMQTAGTFQEDVEEFIAEAELPYEPQPVLVGALGNEVAVDFRVQGKKVLSLVHTLSAPNPANAHPKSIEVFTRWHDLREHHALHQFVTLFDTSSKSYKEFDLERLQEVSTVLGFPEEQEEILEVLAA